MRQAPRGWIVTSLLLLACSDGTPASDAGALPSAGDAGQRASGSGGMKSAGGVHVASEAAPDASSMMTGGHGGAGTTPAAGEPGSDARTDASTGGATRRFWLASAGTQLLVDGPSLGLQLTEANLSDDVDLVAVHQEFYGVPWEAFANDAEPPPEWTAKMQALAQHAHAVSPRVFLSISMLNGSRDSLAARTTIENGQVKNQDNWAAHCYDFASAPDGAQMRAAYLRYVDRMLELFTPSHLNFAIEVNLFLEKCPDAAAGVVEVANAAYAEAKAKAPALVAFPSFQIDHLYGYAEDSCAAGMDKDTCFDRNYAQITDFDRDRFAMSSYPFLQGQHVSDLPADWFERGAARGAEQALIAETGWLSTDLVAQNGSECTTVITSTEQDAADYLARVLSDAERVPLEVVTWWSNRDLVPAGLMTNCPCDYDPTWCSVVDVFRNAAGGPLTPGAAYVGEVLLKAFGTMGVRDYDGARKPKLAAAWDSARSRSPVP